MPPILRGMLKTRDPGLRVVAGSFVPGASGNQASLVHTLASGTPANKLVLTAKSSFPGVAGNGLTYEVLEKTDNDRKATIACTGLGVTNLTSVYRVKAAGAAGNSWVVTCIPHALSGHGVVLNEDDTNKVLTILYETGVSTAANIDTAIAGATYWEAATAAGGGAVSGQFYAKPVSGGRTETTWASYSSPKTTLNFIAATTTLTAAAAAINAISGGPLSATIVGTAGTTYTTTSDALTATALTGGGTQKGKGFSVLQVGAGTYRVTLDNILQAFHMVHATVQVATAKNLRAVVGPIVQASKYFDIYTLSNATLTDGAATDRINFLLFGRDVTR